MKLLKLAVIALFTLGMVSNASAQDENNPYDVRIWSKCYRFSRYPGKLILINFLGSLSRVSLRNI